LFREIRTAQSQGLSKNIGTARAGKRIRTVMFWHVEVEGLKTVRELNMLPLGVV
jgi:hypothetical protein